MVSEAWPRPFNCQVWEALTPVVTEVFQVSHFNLVLKVFPDVAGAVAELGSVQGP